MDPIEEVSAVGNGLHDAKLYVLSVDYVLGVAVLEIGIDMCEYGQPEPALQERRCKIRFRRIVFIDLKAREEMAPCPDGMRIDRFKLLGRELARVWAAHVPAGSFAYTIFISEINGELRVCARDGVVEWLT